MQIYEGGIGAPLWDNSTGRVAGSLFLFIYLGYFTRTPGGVIFKKNAVSYFKR
jgi:hypothetical protein